MKKLLLVALATAFGSSVFANLYSGPGGGIPDSTPAGANFLINVPDAIGAVSFIRLNGLTHTWIGDLVVTVTNASGNSIQLFQRVGSTTSTGLGDSSNLGGDYRFIDGGANLWAAAAAGDTSFVIPGGDYQASSRDALFAYLPVSISGLNNSVAGNWTLNISDNAGGDTGEFNSWDIEAAPVPEPATMAALGMGALALLRRRKKA